MASPGATADDVATLTAQVNVISKQLSDLTVAHEATQGTVSDLAATASAAAGVAAAAQPMTVTGTTTTSTTTSSSSSTELSSYASVFNLANPNVLASNWTTFAVPATVPTSARCLVCEVEGTDINTAATSYLYARQNATQATPQHLAIGRDPASGAAALKTFVNQVKVFFDTNARSFQYQLTFAGATVGVSQCFYNLSFKVIGYE